VKQIDTLKIEKVKVADLHLHPHNARQGDVGAIIQSLENHGQYRPIVVQKSTMRVIAGNHTLMAASQLGWPTVDATVIDVDDDQALRILLVDNRANDLATYDNGALTDLLEALVRSEFGLQGSGFTGSDLDDLLAISEFEPMAEKGKDPISDLQEYLGTVRIVIECDAELAEQFRLVDGDSDLDRLRTLLNGG